MAVGVFAGTQAAHAAGPYLFGLSQSDIDSLHVTYGAHITKDEIEDVFASPLNCATYKDLCETLGTGGAEDFLEYIKDKAIAGDDFTQTTVLSAVSSEFQRLEELYIVQTYTDTVPVDSPYWGSMNIVPASATSTAQTCSAGLPPVGTAPSDDETLENSQ